MTGKRSQRGHGSVRRSMFCFSSTTDASSAVSPVCLVPSGEAVAAHGCRIKPRIVLPGISDEFFDEPSDIGRRKFMSFTADENNASINRLICIGRTPRESAGFQRVSGMRLDSISTGQPLTRSNNR
jgi:hypothetical protein